MISLTEETKKPTAFARLLRVLMENQHQHSSTIFLLGHGILSPAPGIARLKAAGVQIDTIYKTVVDANGVTHKNVAHYKIVGGVAP